MNLDHEQIKDVIGYNYDGKTFNVIRFCCDDHLVETLRGLPGVTKDTIAYTNTFSEAERPDCWADVYVIRGLDVGTAAHESTHLASGIAARRGHRSLELTEDVASLFEEEFCQMIGELTVLIADYMEGDAA